MLEILNLNKSFGNRPVLRDLTLHIAPGEIYGLLGPNGAGKTTTISIICHLIAADSGEVLLDGRSLTAATKKLIGIAPQENLVYDSLTCAENLAFFAKLYGLQGQQRLARVRQCLSGVGLADRAESLAETLSGGMLRRLNMAIALVHQPKLLILDEPTTGLDIEARYEIWELIRNLQQQGMTILLTTHLLEEAERLCQKIGILKQGCLLAQGSLEDLRRLIPAQEMVLIQTSDPAQAIARASACSLTYRRYGHDLAFWLPEHRSLQELLDLFEGIPLDSISRQQIRLEHVYLEVTQNGLEVDPKQESSWPSASTLRNTPATEPKPR